MPIEYNIFEPWLTLDKWQKKYIETEGNCFLLCGRQAGKTTAMSIKFGKRAAENSNRIIGMFAYTEKQAYNLFFKTLMYLRAVYPKMVIEKGPKKPTKHLIYLTNNSVIMCYAVGLTGEGIRTFTLTDLVVDEAAPMAREVFVALSPMLSVTKGNMDLSSTPRGRQGYFYECSDQCPRVKKNWTRFYINGEDCPRHTQTFLEEEREAMTKLEYAQEYLARFLDEIKQFYPDELIRDAFKPMDWNVYKGRIPQVDKFLGVDVARMGGDETVLLTADRIEREHINMIEMDIKSETKLTDTVKLILEKDLFNHYKKIYIDDGGLGAGVLDPLLENKQTKWKVTGINNSSRYYEHKWVKGKEKGGQSRLMKEEG
ncbi:hypothetical protein LCGC14_2784400, partial [marine sediment metagenome]